MEEPVNLYRMTLKDLALRRVAVLSCSHPTMYRNALAMQLPAFKEPHVTAIDNMSRDILAKLSLPASTNEELVNIMKPVFREIIKWLIIHENFLEPDNSNLQDLENLEHLCWTRLGTINYPETVEALIRHEKLRIDQRYKLACLYCLKDHVRQLWRKVPVESKKPFYHKTSPLNVKQPEIVVYWTYIIKGRANKLNSFLNQEENICSSVNQYVFESAALEGYRSATQYFFEKLTAEEKEESLVRTTCSVAEERSFDYCSHLHEYQRFSDVMCFLLSVLRPEQIQEVLEAEACETLKCLLDWPRQGSFIDLAQHAVSYLSEDDYSRLLYILSRNHSLGYNYSKIFRDLFRISPRNFKSYTLDRYAHFLQDFFRIGDVQTIKFIFRNLNAAEIEELIFGALVLCNCYELIKDGKWDLLKLFFQESRLSKEDRRKYAISFVSRFDSLLEPKTCQRFIKFVNEIDEDTSNQNVSNRVDHIRPINFQPTERSGEEPTLRRSKRRKKA